MKKIDLLIVISSFIIAGIIFTAIPGAFIQGGTRMNVKNQYGKEVNFDEALKLMDADLRENVAYELSLSSDQEFFNKYAEAHKEKFGVTWGPDQEK